MEAMKSLFACFFLCLFLGEVHAAVSVSSLFGDHMVLQQGTSLPIWGEADPGEKVCVHFVGQNVRTTADAHGMWRVNLTPVYLRSSPDVLEISGKNNTLIFSDVIVGDVWLCGGGSNMACPLSQSWRGSESLAQADDSQLRFFVVQSEYALMPQKRVQGKWERCTPETAAHFSAVGYFFARDLRKTTAMPLGLIGVYKNATPVAAWVSLQALRESPSLNHQLSSSLFNGMIAPLIPYAIAGMIWYQGECDEGAKAFEYRLLFSRLIRSWRAAWGEGPFPFYFVQLAGHYKKTLSPIDLMWDEEREFNPAWPWIREGQAAGLLLPETGMAVATDLGSVEEVVPLDKMDVGRRLGLLARKNVYGQKVIASGPFYKRMKKEGSKIRIFFEEVGTGLTIGEPPWSDDRMISLATKLTGFAIAGPKRSWKEASAVIEGNSVLVFSDAVQHPEAVRYNWKNNPVGNLYNKEGLPAAPFRTDLDEPE